VHIPRTGGRFLTKLFRENNYDCKFNYFYKIKSKNKEIEIPHLAYPDYTGLFKEKNIKYFTIVRDPVSRFQSLLKKHVTNLDKIFYSKNNFVNYINKEIISCNNNWFLPQVNFITKNTFLWKFENNLDKDFFNWLYTNFGFNFKIKNVDYDKHPTIDEGEVILNKKQIDWVKEYYYQDYKILEY
tara:strand:+ start:122 stop:673 length:552 start_codon:yes stop_codon:yes gene_type:complete